MRIILTYEITNIYRELYHFDVHTDSIHYVAIYYSHRNDDSDLWGDQWNTFYQNNFFSKLDKLATDHPSLEQAVADMRSEYNPVKRRTDLGHTYYHGMAGRISLPRPKMTEQQIREGILTQVAACMNNCKIKGIDFAGVY